MPEKIPFTVVPVKTGLEEEMIMTNFMENPAPTDFMEKAVMII